MQQPDGSWPYTEPGATALAGLTLLECDVPATHRSIQKAAARIREAATRTTYTYSIALSILAVLPDAASFDVKILATHINHDVLSFGEQGDLV